MLPLYSIALEFTQNVGCPLVEIIQLLSRPVCSLFQSLVPGDSFFVSWYVLAMEFHHSGSSNQQPFWAKRLGYVVIPVLGKILYECGHLIRKAKGR